MTVNLTHRTEDMLPLIESSTYLGFRFSEEIKKDLLKQIFKILVFWGYSEHLWECLEEKSVFFLKKTQLWKIRISQNEITANYIFLFSTIFVFTISRNLPSPLSFIPADSSFNLNKKSVVKKKKTPIIKL